MSLRVLSKSAIAILGASVFTLMLPGLSVAKDLCLTIGSGSPPYLLIGKGFTVPSKGKCKPWTGLTEQGPTVGSSTNSPSAGTACTSSDGSHMNLTITTSFPSSGDFFLDSISVALPGLTGTDFNARLGTGDTIGSFTAVGAFCAPVPIPAVANESPETTTQGTGPGPR